jgi:hypothetical protein
VTLSSGFFPQTPPPVLPRLASSARRTETRFTGLQVFRKRADALMVFAIFADTSESCAPPA